MSRSRGSVRRRRLLLWAGALVSTALAGCTSNPWAPDSDEAGDGFDDGAGPDGDDQGAEDDPEVTDDAGNETTDGTQPEYGEPDHVVDVAPDGFQFEPSSLEIEPGETVRWIWRDDGHNVRVRSKPDGSSWSGTAGSGSDTYPAGHEHTFTFETPGTYRYFCAPHQTLGLEGSITVLEP